MSNDAFAALLCDRLADPTTAAGVVRILQRGLLAAGYDLGKSGPGKDGVDGVAGDLTTRAFVLATGGEVPDPADGTPWSDLDRLDAALAAVAPTLADSERTEWVAHLSTAAARWGINTPARLAMWLAQLGHESAGFTSLEENLNYSADGLMQTFRRRIEDRATAERLARRPEEIANHVYGNRPDLGNDQPGDGWRFRGRGLIQVTGRANYRQAGAALGLDLEGVPAFAAEPVYAAQIAGWFWQSRRLNRFADSADLWGCTRAITGAPDTAAHKKSTGLAARRRLWAAAKAALGVA